MNAGTNEFIALDLPPLLTALFAALTSALFGNFLVLRRQSLMGDAISHAVVPGIVAAFLISGSRSALPVFAGAAAAGVLSALLMEAVRRLGHVEPGAAMGVIFSLFFAAGVLLMEQASARNVDLDADCLLYGQLETIFWEPPADWAVLLSSNALNILPPQLLRSCVIFLLALAVVKLLYKELVISSFDPALSTSLGFNAGLLQQLLLICVAAAVVVSFEAVGAILVIAMIICPPAAARLLTDRLRVQILYSLILAAAAVIGGYFLGAFAPYWTPLRNSVSAAGSIAVAAGICLAAAVLFAPRYGIIAARLRRELLALQVVEEDLLGLLYRAAEGAAENHAAAWPPLYAVLGGGLRARAALFLAQRKGHVARSAAGLKLTPPGLRAASEIIRSHRLWESFLVEQAGLRADHVHDRATELEHYTSEELQHALAEQHPGAATDPHGRTIPR